jgi:hypothetical protein
VTADLQWSRRQDRRLFTLAPFRLLGAESEDVVKSAQTRPETRSDSGFILVANFDDRGVVRRLRATADEVSRAASELAEKTTFPVIVGRVVGVGKGGVPIFQSVGRVWTAKADPMSPEAFEEWAMSMSRGMRGASRGDLATMSAEAMEHLEISYAGASQAQLDRALAGYRGVIATPKARMLNAQRVEISNALRTILRRTTNAALKIPEVNAGLAAGFSIRDREVARLMSRHHSVWVRNRHGQISQVMSAQARTIIGRGLDRGLGRDEIGRELSQMTNRGVRQPHYYRTVAANHVSRARSYSVGSSYRAAGIEYFRIEAVLDDRTTHQCEFLHGKILPVSASMARLDQIMTDQNPQSMLWNQPFIRDRGDHLDIQTPDGQTQRVANITERSSGASPSGVSATFARGMNQGQLVDAAIGLPPYHHGCRSVTIPA